MKQKEKIEVSIIIPCYNAEKYLAKCLDSIFNQTFQKFELICVNDGSTDNTLKILKNYEKKYNKMSIISKKNEGGKNILQPALKNVKGKYVCVIDNDDFIDKRYLEALYNTITRTKSDIAICAFQREDYLTNKIYSIEMKKKANVYNLKNDYGVLLEVNTSLWNKMYKKEVISNILNFNLNSLGLGDMTINSFIYSNVERIAFNENILYHYKVREGSNITSMKLEVIDSIYDNLIRIRKYYFENKKEMLEFIDAYAFLHLGVSLMYRVYQGHKMEFDKILKNNIKVLNEEFPLWKQNKYYKLNYVLHNKRNLKLHICYIFYKIGMFKYFIKLYSVITKKLKFDIKW